MFFSNREEGKRALDIGKYIIDQGVHAPTVYFPLIVHEDMMIEPTESASKDDLDRYAMIMEDALKEDVEQLKKRPLNLGSRRIDEVKAARDLILKWN